jgi:hypothetical protein
MVAANKVWFKICCGTAVLAGEQQAVGGSASQDDRHLFSKSLANGGSGFAAEKVNGALSPINHICAQYCQVAL